MWTWAKVFSFHSHTSQQRLRRCSRALQQGITVMEQSALNFAIPCCMNLGFRCGSQGRFAHISTFFLLSSLLSSTSVFAMEDAQKWTIFITTGALCISIQMQWQQTVSAEQAFISTDGSLPQPARSEGFGSRNKDPMLQMCWEMSGNICYYEAYVS